MSTGTNYVANQVANLVTAYRLRSGGGGGDAWSPLSLTNARWTHADDLNVAAEGSEVTAWSDKSSNADMNFTEPAAGHNGLLRLALFNGKAAIEFNGASGDSGMTGSLSLAAAPFTVALIMAPRSAVSGNYRALNGGTGNWLVGPYTGHITYYNGDFLFPAAALDTTKLKVVVVTQEAGPLGKLYINNTLIGGNGNGNIPGTLNIGDRGAFAEAAGAFITDIIAMPGAVITPTELTALQSWAVTTYDTSIG